MSSSESVSTDVFLCNEEYPFGIRGGVMKNTGYFGIDIAGVSKITKSMGICY